MFFEIIIFYLGLQKYFEIEMRFLSQSATLLTGASYAHKKIHQV